MRHYRIGSTGDESSDEQRAGGRSGGDEKLNYTKPLIVVMGSNDHHHHPHSSFHWCRSNKFKVIAAFMLALLTLQYLFGASIYNIRIFDYNIAQIYIWNEAKSGGVGAGDEQSSNLISSSSNNSATVGVISTARSPPLDGSSSSSLSTTFGSTESSSSSLASSSSSSSAWSSTSLTDISSEKSATSESTVFSSTVFNNASSSSSPSNVTLPQCPLLPPVLVGPIRVWFDYPSHDELDKLYPDLETGGHGKPKECVSRHKVAIIIPYRDRDKHLRGFLHNMHSLLRKQQLDYTIFVVEQIENQTFNRAKLMNVGFAEAMKLYDWQCAIFHDVDLLPEDDRNIYSCPEQPRHMSVAVDKFSYRLPYNEIFGGISALTVDQFKTLNGFSNDYWGWGGEDDDMASRVKIHKYQISRYPAQIARYKMIKHVLDKENPVNECRYNLMYKVNKRWKTDGLTSLNYNVVSLDRKHLYTRVLVDLLEAESKKRLDDERVCAKKKG